MKTLQQYKQAVALLCVGLLLAACSGCAQLGLATPETFNQKAAVAYATTTQVRATAATLVNAKKLTAEDGKNVQDAADVARAGIETARKVHAVDPSAGNAKLESVRIALQAVQSYLASRGSGS